MKRIDAPTAAKLVAEGAVLIDIRERDEHARERIPGARHQPLTRIGDAAPIGDDAVVVFHCRSGMRTTTNADALAAGARGCETYLLEGGLDAWKRAGLPVERGHAQPLELNRQVQIAAGTLVLAGVFAGWLLDPAWYLLPAAIGAGLVFAGVTGTCGLARLLVHMPWNHTLR